MTRRYTLLLALLFSLAFTQYTPQSKLDVADNQAVLAFPDRVTFTATLTSDAAIDRVVLEYGIANQTTCGEVIAKAFPTVRPGSKSAKVEWVWEMRQSGSEPPGAQIWWRWRVHDSNGNDQVSDEQTVTWLNDDVRWQTKSGGNINLHWYYGSASFGNDLHTAAVRSLADLEKQTGLTPQQPIDLFIYAGTDDLRSAVLYEPGWTGGLAYADYNIAIIGIAPGEEVWGKRAQAHELTHVLVGNLTFSCLGIIPTWLNEGLAVYGEGGLEEQSRTQLEEAIAADHLLPVRALSGGFAEDPGQANLSYSESYSLVNYLIERYGHDKMIALLQTLRDSATVDAGLQQIYGFDIEGFEDEWRAAIGAAPRTADTRPTPTTNPTQIPTLIPVSGVPIQVTIAAIPTIEPTPELTPTVLPPPPATEAIITPTPAPELYTTLYLILGAVCSGLLCVTGLTGLIVFIVIGRRGTQA
jgi:hypothetical protein